MLSALGMGAMRLPTLEDGSGTIDERAAAEMVAYAMEQGINYFDTAWGYHNGHSETVLGKILSGYPRECFYLADKFPGYDVTWRNRRKFLKSNWKNAGWTILTFIFFIR